MEAAVKDIFYMLPDSIIYGSLLVGTLTLSQQHLIFFLTLMESIFFFRGFDSVISSLNGAPRIDLLKCKGKLQGITFLNLTEHLRSSAISYGVFILSFASTYFVNSLTALKEELEVLETSYTKHANIVTYVLLSLTLIYAIMNILLGCESFTSVSLGLVLGLCMGIILVFQNVQLFGKQAVNFVGIPLLRSRTADNKPIYICSQ